MREILELIESPVIRRFVFGFLIILSLLAILLKFSFLILIIITVLQVLEVIAINSLVAWWIIYGITATLYLVGYAVIYVYLHSKI